MVGDTVGVVGADVGGPELVYQELRELEDSGGELFDLVEEPPIVRQLRGHRVEFADHADAGARGCDDSLVVLEDPYETPDQRYRLALVASVEVHLAAAGLIQREVHLYTEAFKDLDGRLPRLREERVVKARDKERDAHVGCLLLPYAPPGERRGPAPRSMIADTVAAGFMCRRPTVKGSRLQRSDASWGGEEEGRGTILSTRY